MSTSVEGFDELYGEAFGELVRYAYRRVGVVQEAEDLVQESFVKALDAQRRGVGWTVNARAWMYRIVGNLIVDRSRSRKPLDGFCVALDGLPVVAEMDTWEPLDQVAANALAERFWGAFAALPAEHQRSLYFYYVEGWSNGEVAAMCGRSVGAEKSMRFRARAGLRALMEAPNDGDGWAGLRRDGE